MNALTILLVLLAACVLIGVIRKFRGGTVLPPFDPDGENTRRDADGRWWRYDPKSRSWEEVFSGRRKKK